MMISKKHKTTYSHFVRVSFDFFTHLHTRYQSTICYAITPKTPQKSKQKTYSADCLFNCLKICTLWHTYGCDYMAKIAEN